MSWADSVTKDRIEAVEAMKDALGLMDLILADPLVFSQRGYAFTDCDVDVLEAGKAALAQWQPNPRGGTQRLRNEERLDKGVYAVSRAEMMVRRNGFYDVMSEGNQTLDTDAFNRVQRQQIEDAWAKCQKLTAYSRN